MNFDPDLIDIHDAMTVTQNQKRVTDPPGIGVLPHQSFGVNFKGMKDQFLCNLDCPEEPEWWMFGRSWSMFDKENDPNAN